MKKKKTRRSSYQYPAIEKSVNLKSRKEETEDVKSYFNQLNSEEKDWMNRFMEEYNHANFEHDGERIHKTKKQKKACFDKNNSRNRCIHTQEQAKNTLKYVERIEEFEKMEIGEFSKPVKVKRKKT